MLKLFLIIGGVLALLIGGIFALRSSTRTGMPGEDVLKRAAERSRELDAKDADREP